MKPPWRPDWRDKNLYPNANSTSSLQWAWEFLRRNPEYQRLWTQLKPRSKPAKILGFKVKFHIMALDLSLPPSPSENEPNDLNFEKPFILYRGSEKGGPIPLDFAIEQNQLIALFNLSWPISPQVAHVKKALLEAAKESH
jgi:transcriptional regulator